MLRGELMANGKGPNSASPAFSMSEFQNDGSIVHTFGGSELCICEDGNWKFRADYDKKTVYNLLVIMSTTQGALVIVPDVAPATVQ